MLLSQVYPLSSIQKNTWFEKEKQDMRGIGTRFPTFGFWSSSRRVASSCVKREGGGG